jgi:hypothetical protein
MVWILLASTASSYRYKHDEEGDGGAEEDDPPFLKEEEEDGSVKPEVGGEGKFCVQKSV